MRGTDSTVVPEDIELTALRDVYHITPLNLLPLVLLAVLSIRKVPASLALTAATLFAGVCGAVLQPDVVQGFAEDGGGVVVESVKGVWQAMATGFQMDSGVSEVDRLVSRGGMASMLPTIWLIIGAVTFWALLEEFGMIARLVDPLIAAAKSTGRLFVAVFVSALQYLPYALFNIASPALSVLYGFTGFRIEHLPATTPDTTAVDPAKERT